PPVAGDLEVAGATIRFTPTRPLAAGATYTISLAPGVREVGGRTARQPVAATFRTRAPRLLVLGQDGGRPGPDLVDPTTGTPRRLTGADEAVGAAAASPDGQEVAYVVRDGPTRWSLRVVRTDGTDRRTIVPDGTGTVGSLAWSPRGDLIAYEHRDALGD